MLSVGYINTKRELNKTKNPTQAAKEEAKDLVSKLSGYLALPANEQPTVATVKDRDQLQDAALKDAVKNGDKILVYAKAQVIVVYRPSTNKIVLFQPLNLTSTQPAAKDSTQDTATTSTEPAPDALTAPATTPTNP